MLNTESSSSLSDTNEAALSSVILGHFTTRGSSPTVAIEQAATASTTTTTMTELIHRRKELDLERALGR